METAHPAESELVYDWNRAGGAAVPARGTVELDDETLRDGLQSPSVRSPSIENKLAILHLMESLGIDEILSYDRDFDRVPLVSRVEP